MHAQHKTHCLGKMFILILTIIWSVGNQFVDEHLCIKQHWKYEMLYIAIPVATVRLPLRDLMVLWALRNSNCKTEIQDFMSLEPKHDEAFLLWPQKDHLQLGNICMHFSVWWKMTYISMSQNQWMCLKCIILIVNKFSTLQDQQRLSEKVSEQL